MHKAITTEDSSEVAETHIQAHESSEQLSRSLANNVATVQNASMTQRSHQLGNLL